LRKKAKRERFFLAPRSGTTPRTGRPQALDLRRAAERPAEEFHRKRKQQSDHQAKDRTAGNQQRPIGRVGSVRKVWWLDQRKALGALFVGQPSAILRLEQVVRDLAILLPRPVAWFSSCIACSRMAGARADPATADCARDMAEERAA
jgi:hypothetical protein